MRFQMVLNYFLVTMGKIAVMTKVKMISMELHVLLKTIQVRELFITFSTYKEF